MTSAGRKRHFIAYATVAVVSALPILLHVVKLIGAGEFSTGWDILSTGDLILVAAALAAGSATEVMLQREDRGLTDAEFAIVVAILVLLFTAGLAFGYVSVGDGASHKALIGWCSILPFLASLGLGTATIFATADKGDQ